MYVFIVHDLVEMFIPYEITKWLSQIILFSCTCGNVDLGNNLLSKIFFIEEFDIIAHLVITLNVIYMFWFINIVVKFNIKATHKFIKYNISVSMWVTLQGFW